MKYLIPILIIAILFIAGCGNDENKTSNTSNTIDNISDAKEPAVKKTDSEDIQCAEDEVDIGGECEPIDPYGVLEEVDEPEPVVEEEAKVEIGVKTFEIIADNYEFYIDGVENPDMIVKVNDTIIIELTSIEGSHNWNVPKFAARSKTVSTNETITLEFVADVAGTFTYYCAVGKHQNIGQKGKFIVE